ncbi:hypothetical protein HanXRQr2_Chr10g0421971 [Helianthus annuus]|uniref:Uncharacterized protein n=1 Tax=Helianthus annuus TaxID=4232 RepID=A0A9K3HVG5_HELAN|nr:hypothetical protein HanXRQr2_Chr10g0421971 [Helianthus annuus]
MLRRPIGSIVLYFWTIEISTSFIAYVKQEVGVQFFKILLMIMLTNMINFVLSLIVDNYF